MTEKLSVVTPPLACVILTAGQGTRMRSLLPKVLHPLAGMPMVGHVLVACAELLPERIVVVVGPNRADLESAVLPNRCVTQAKPLGTGDAVKAARKELEGYRGDILILYGDTPLLTPATLSKICSIKNEKKADLVVSGFYPEDQASYGRLIQDEHGKLTAIVEAAEALEEHKKIKLCNGGIMLFTSEKLWPLLEQLRDDNSKGEFYLTDCVSHAVRDGLVCAVAEVPAEDILGVNTRVELAEAEAVIQNRLRRSAMLGGATLVDPLSVFFSFDTKVGKDVTIGPNVVFATGVEVGNKVSIRAFCHIEQTRIEEGAIIGPFARLRPGSVVGAGAHIGNFVEIKNSDVGAGAKINHLSYIGDAFVGARANIGAGAITCNYDGFRKFHTHIGSETFIGSNSSIVAPVKIGDGAYVGAGSVITVEVPAHTLAVARGRQSNINDWARRFREEQSTKGKPEK